MQGLTRRGIGRTGIAAGAGILTAPMINGAAKAQAVKLMMSHVHPPAALIHQISEKFAGYVAEGTKGQVTVEVRPASQLFNLRGSVEAIQLGTLDFCYSDLGTFGNWQPHLGFTSLPFLFTDFDHVKRVLYGKVGEMVRADVKQTMGVEALALGATGFRVFAGRKEIRNAADCRGIKLRVPEVPVFVEMGRALGANPTPIPAGEMYTALQAGVVDAVELPPDVVANFKLWEVAQHVTRTNHIFTEASIFASTTSTGMRGLSAQNWQIVREAGRRALEVDNWDLNLKAQTAAWQSLTERMKAVGDPDIASFRERTAPVIAGFTAKTGAKGKAFVEATMAA